MHKMWTRCGQDVDKLDKIWTRGGQEGVQEERGQGGEVEADKTKGERGRRRRTRQGARGRQEVGRRKGEGEDKGEREKEEEGGRGTRVDNR